MTSYSQKYPTDYEQIVNEAQIENGNIASEIHGFTIVYGKFTLITISTAIRKKKNKNFSPCIHAIVHTYCYYNFNPCGILRI